VKVMSEILFESFWGVNLSFEKAGIAVGVVDLVSIVYDAIINFDAFQGCES
jgi:hypothetical protein